MLFNREKHWLFSTIDTCVFYHLNCNSVKNYIIFFNKPLKQKNPDFLHCSEFFMPGLVDTHIHAPQYSYAGTGLDLPLLQWLNNYTFPAESRFKDLDFANRVYTQVVVSPKNTSGVRHKQVCEWRTLNEVAWGDARGIVSLPVVQTGCKALQRLTTYRDEKKTIECYVNPCDMTLDPYRKGRWETEPPLPATLQQYTRTPLCGCAKLQVRFSFRFTGIPHFLSSTGSPRCYLSGECNSWIKVAPDVKLYDCQHCGVLL